MRTMLSRLGEASPLVPALLYTAAAWLANIAATVAPTNDFLLLVALLIWAVVAAAFVVVVVWYRTDDWLAAGFLLAVTLLLSSWTANLMAEAIEQRSLVPVLLGAPGLFLGVAIRAVIGTPVLGAGVATLRWVTVRVRSARV